MTVSLFRTFMAGLSSHGVSPWGVSPRRYCVACLSKLFGEALQAVSTYLHELQQEIETCRAECYNCKLDAVTYCLKK
jgi:hypothetical protein